MTTRIVLIQKYLLVLKYVHNKRPFCTNGDARTQESKQGGFSLFQVLSETQRRLLKARLKQMYVRTMKCNELK